MVAIRRKVFRGDRLRAIREQRQFSQDELAARLGFGASQMNRYENGKADPSMDVLKRMAAELQVTTDWLLGLTDEPTEYFQMEDLSPDELDLIASFRKADLETLMRIALERKKPKQDAPPAQS